MAARSAATKRRIASRAADLSAASGQDLDHGSHCAGARHRRGRQRARRAGARRQGGGALRRQAAPTRATPRGSKPGRASTSWCYANGAGRREISRPAPRRRGARLQHADDLARDHRRRSLRARLVHPLRRRPRTSTSRRSTIKAGFSGAPLAAVASARSWSAHRSPPKSSSKFVRTPGAAWQSPRCPAPSPALKAKSRARSCAVTSTRAATRKASSRPSKRG